MGVPEKVGGYYLQKIVPVLDKGLVSGYRSIRQRFCKRKNQKIAWSTYGRILGPYLTQGEFSGSNNLWLF